MMLKIVFFKSIHGLYKPNINSLGGGFGPQKTKHMMILCVCIVETRCRITIIDFLS